MEEEEEEEGKPIFMLEEEEEEDVGKMAISSLVGVFESGLHGLCWVPEQIQVIILLSKQIKYYICAGPWDNTLISGSQGAQLSSKLLFQAGTNIIPSKSKKQSVALITR